MRNLKFSNISKIIIICLIVQFPINANFFQDNSNKINLYTDLSGTERIDSLNQYALDLRWTNTGLRMSIGRKCYLLSKKEKYTLGIIQSTCNIGAVFFHSQQVDSALIYYKRSYNLAKKDSNIVWMMNLSTNIGQAFSNKYQFDSAVVYYNKGLLNAETIKDSSAIGYLINSIGISYWKRGEFNLAKEKFKLGLSIHRKLGNSKRIVRSLNSLGSAYWNLKNNHIALQYYIEALEIENTYQEVNSPLILNNIGLLYLELNDTTLANSYFQKGLESSEIKNSTLGKGYSYLNFGDLNFKKQNYNRTLEFYNRAMSFYETLKDANGIAKILNKIGQVFLKIHNYNLAETKFQTAYKTSETNGLKLVQTESLINICRIQILQGENFKARINLNHAYKIANSENFVESKLEIFNLQTTVHENLKDFSLALNFHYKYERLKDSLFNEQSTRIIIDIKEKYEADEKELRNIRLQQINNIQRLELEIKKSEMLYTILASIFSFFVITYLVFLNIQRKKRNELLLKSKEEVEKFNSKLNETNNLLNQSNSTKDKFFSIIAHDLKNPFVTLLGASEVLKNDNSIMVEEDKTEFIEMIYNDANKLYSLLENLLFWASSQTGNLHAKKRTLNLNNLVAEITLLYKSSLDYKNINLDIKIPKEYQINFDEFMFNTIIRNLLSNAIKFSFNGGKIIIVAEEIDGKIHLLVKDNGMGIEKKNLPKLFDESSNYKELGTNKEKGTGLGLILCRDFARENNADIEVTSDVGKGTTFELIMEKGK
jgi:signal transduction histidine kinase/Flp pilus assembly protein TadD